MAQVFLPGLEHANRTVRLSEGEAALVVDVLNGSMLPQSIFAKNDPGLLLDEIAEALEEDDENLAAKHGVDYESIGEKTRTWSWIQAPAASSKDGVSCL